MWRLLAIIPLFLAMTSCTIKTCKVEPNVDIVIEKDPKTGEEKRTTQQIIKDSVQPGGQVSCSF